MARRVAILLVAYFCCMFCGCDSGLDFLSDDLSRAREAYTERNWPLAERLLERYLRQEQDPDKRWLAWELLLKAINSTNQEARASLECLEAMLMEYENDGGRVSHILVEIGKYNERLRRFDRAADVWSAYVELAEIDDMKRVEGLRHLAAAQFNQRQFDAGEETLQQCMALPLSDHDKIHCMLDLANAHMAREHWQDVSNLCQQILDSGPDSSVLGLAGYLRGDALEQMGQDAEALRQFERVRNHYPNPMVIDNRVEHLRKNSRNKTEKK